MRTCWYGKEPKMYHAEIEILTRAGLFCFWKMWYGMVHLACWLTVPLLALYNGQRGKYRWLGKCFYWYYPAHMALIGVILRMLLFISIAAPASFSEF